MCTACAAKSKVSGMKRKAKKGRRRASVSGFSVKGAFSGLTNIKTLGTAGATVWGIKHMTEKATGKELAVLRSKQGGMLTGGAGLLGLMVFKNPIVKGVALGLLADGAKKYLTGSGWDGVELPEKTDSVAGYPWRPTLDMSGGRVVANGRAAYAYR